MQRLLRVRPATPMARSSIATVTMRRHLAAAPQLSPSAPLRWTPRCPMHTIVAVAAAANNHQHPHGGAAILPDSAAASSPFSPLRSSRVWPPSTDTIYQLSSGLGSARGQSAVGVAIIRVSGPLALDVLRILTRTKKDIVPRMAMRASVYEPPADTRVAEALERGEPLLASSTLPPADPAHLLDSGILTLAFPGPASFTGEDVCELHVHGTPLIVSSVFAAMEGINRTLVERMIDRATPSGASAADLPAEDPAARARRSAILSCPPLIRLATAGEFTRRAFQNGKLDLTQVEALGDLLQAETDRQRSQALIQMRGALGQLYTQWRADLLHSLAYVEAILDFSEDEQDVGESEIWQNVLPKVQDLTASMRAHLEDHRRGELVREGLAVVIVGAPNAGKSTLLNALAQRQVAIVSPVPGTTRDVVENRINIAGWPCTLADTAGLREIRQRQAKEHQQHQEEEGDMISAGASTSSAVSASSPSEVALLTGHDLIEAEGIRRTYERTLEADLKLVLLDASKLLDPLSRVEIDRQVMELIDERSIAVWTKMDLLALPPAPSDSTTVAVPYSSASTAGRAKLRTASQFYSDHRDSFTPDQLAAFQRAASCSSNFQRVSLKTPHFVFLACPAARADQQPSSGSRSQGVQQLLAAIEKQIQRIVGVDAAADMGASSPSALGVVDPSSPVITRQRHRLHVESCLVFLDLFSDYMHRGDIVLAAEQLRLATREIGKITGRIDVEELLDVIFEDFCIGK